MTTALLALFVFIALILAYIVWTGLVINPPRDTK